MRVVSARLSSAFVKFAEALMVRLLSSQQGHRLPRMPATEPFLTQTTPQQSTTTQRSAQLLPSCFPFVGSNPWASSRKPTIQNPVLGLLLGNIILSAGIQLLCDVTWKTAHL